MTRKGEAILSELQFVDYFHSYENDFKILFNNESTSYPASALESTPLELGYFGKYKYEENVLKLRRLKAAIKSK